MASTARGRGWGVWEAPLWLSFCSVAPGTLQRRILPPVGTGAFVGADQTPGSLMETEVEAPLLHDERQRHGPPADGAAPCGPCTLEGGSGGSLSAQSPAPAIVRPSEPSHVAALRCAGVGVS